MTVKTEKYLGLARRLKSMKKMKASAVFVFIRESQTLGFSERLQEKEIENKNKKKKTKMNARKK